MTNSSVYQNAIKLILEFGRFGLVGIIRTFLGIIFIFVPYNLWDVNYVLCNIVGYSVGLITGFILHKRWTFRSQGEWDKEAIPYLVTFGVGYLVNMILLLLSAEKLRLNKNISQVIAICGFTTTNYLGNKFWTFRKGQGLSE
ncbi:TPA: GtrA family protein [Candidatus Poribacteria bacterium]|nr:GtrA family protein [Candidatus Poribacteria bacterium]